MNNNWYNYSHLNSYYPYSNFITSYRFSNAFPNNYLYNNPLTAEIFQNSDEDIIDSKDIKIIEFPDLNNKFSDSEILTNLDDNSKDDSTANTDESLNNNFDNKENTTDNNITKDGINIGPVNISRHGLNLFGLDLKIDDIIIIVIVIFLVLEKNIDILLLIILGLILFDLSFESIKSLF